MVRQEIDFYFDCISPFTLLGWVQMFRYEKIWNVNVNLKPFFLGGVMKNSGNKPPGLVPNKAKYMMTYDLPR
jgi:glutathione S-transferase kappa 1